MLGRRLHRLRAPAPRFPVPLVPLGHKTLMRTFVVQVADAATRLVIGLSSITQLVTQKNLTERFEWFGTKTAAENVAATPVVPQLYRIVGASDPPHGNAGFAE